MTVLFVWSLEEIEGPRLITSDNHVIDVLNTDPLIWEKHLSLKNKQSVTDQLRRWKVAVQTCTDAIKASGYAIGGNGHDFPHWFLHESGNHPERSSGH